MSSFYEDHIYIKEKRESKLNHITANLLFHFILFSSYTKLGKMTVPSKTRQCIKWLMFIFNFLFFVSQNIFSFFIYFLTLFKIVLSNLSWKVSIDSFGRWILNNIIFKFAFFINIEKVESIYIKTKIFTEYYMEQFEIKVISSIYIGFW